MGDDLTYGRAAVLRLALSSESAELADLARGLVRTDANDWGHPGSHTEHAARLLAAAQEVLRLAVAADRSGGASWNDIGEALEVTKQAASERFGKQAAAYDDAILRGWLLADVPRDPYTGPDGMRGSTETAQLLDTWVRQHADYPADLPDRPVSAKITPISTAEFGSLLAAALTLKIQATTDTSLSPRDQWRIDLGYAQRRVEWHERMIAEEVGGPGRTGTPMDDHHEMLTVARQRLAEVEAREPKP